MQPRNTVPIGVKRGLLPTVSNALCHPAYLRSEDVKAFWYSPGTGVFRCHLSDVPSSLTCTQAAATASSTFPPLPSAVSRETETSSHTNTPKNSLDTQVNQCLHSSQTTNQSVTRQTAPEPGKENMLFFWASFNFTAYKTQPHGAHPTHGAIKTPVSHLKPIVTRHRPRKLRPGPQACAQSPSGIVRQHSHTNELFLQAPSY